MADQEDQPPARPRRRQARGERRIGEILDAAAAVFAGSGYERASTNAIAAAAGISPGSLYQFFPNKAAIADALGRRYAEGMAAAHAAAFDGTPPAGFDLDGLLDRVIDPIVAFNLANPGFKALLDRPDVPPALGDATEPIHAALQARVERLLAAAAPTLPEADRRRRALVLIGIVKGTLPLVLAAEGPERAAVVAELKLVVRGYVAPLLG